MAFKSVSKSVPAASSAKFLAKKKRRSKSMKSKQGKLDARRQVKNEGCQEELSGGGEIYARNGKNTPADGEKDGSIHNGSNSDSSSKSLSSGTGSAVGSNCSGTNFSGSIRSCSSGTSYSRNMSEGGDGGLDDWEAVADALAATDDKEGQFEKKLEKKSVVELDHLPEAVKQPIPTKDVLKPKLEKLVNHQPEVVNQPTATVDVVKPKQENGQAWRHGYDYHSKPKPEFGQEWRRSNAFQSKPKPGLGQGWKPKPEKHDQKCKSLAKDINVSQSDHQPEVVKKPTAVVNCWKAKPGNRLGWRNDDAFHAKSLPNPQKKHFSIKGNRHLRHGGTTSGYKNFVSAPASCPICFEDLDSTDSSFLPCPCGFQLCLFCHKRILEEDGRCPGCREHYDNNAVKCEENSDMLGDCSMLRLARSVA